MVQCVTINNEIKIIVLHLAIVRSSKLVIHNSVQWAIIPVLTYYDIDVKSSQMSTLSIEGIDIKAIQEDYFYTFALIIMSE